VLWHTTAPAAAGCPNPKQCDATNTIAAPVLTENGSIPAGVFLGLVLLGTYRCKNPTKQCHTRTSASADQSMFSLQACSWA
jgi:hypothetical protein